MAVDHSQQLNFEQIYNSICYLINIFLISLLCKLHFFQVRIIFMERLKSNTHNHNGKQTN